jgi:hypothetical protein
MKKFKEWADERSEKNLMSWFGDSKVRGSDGRPAVVYHGTSDAIHEFDPKASEGLGSFARKGIFFTDSPESAGAYALQRQNLAFKRTIAALNKAKEEYDELLHSLANKAKSHAPKSYGGETVPRTVLRWINDLHREGKIDDRDYEQYEKLEKALLTAEEDYESNNRTRWEDAKPNTMPVYLKMERPMEVEAGGMPWDAVVPANLAEFNPSKNDGIIFRNVVDNADESEAKTTVYVVFDPRQVKSAIGNNGNFNPNSTKIVE